MATQQHYKSRPTHMFHHRESHWQYTASGNWWCKGSAVAGQDVYLWAWNRAYLSSLCWPIRRERGALMCMALIGSDPHSRHSSFQQEVDQNNLARIQFLSDSHRSPLISPGCYFCCCKPVIIQGMKWTQNTSKGRENVFLPRQHKKKKTKPTLTSRENLAHFNEETSRYSKAHMSFHFFK